MKNLLLITPLFSELCEQDYSLLRQNTELKVFDRQSVLFRKGDAADKLYIIRKGSVKLFNTRSGNTKEEIVCHLRIGEFFCLAPLLSGVEFHISAKTLEKCELIMVPREIIQALIQRSHKFSNKVIQFLSCEGCYLCEKICDLSLSTTKERLAKYLIQEYRRRGRRSFPLDMNQTQLAYYLGTVRETLSRDLACLKKSHIITQKKSSLKILDLETLYTLAGTKLSS